MVVRAQYIITKSGKDGSARLLMADVAALAHGEFPRAAGPVAGASPKRNFR